MAGGAESTLRRIRTRFGNPVRPAGDGRQTGSAGARRDSVAVDVATLVGGAAVAQAVVLVAMPVLSRLYSPTSFGHFGVFLAIASLVATIGTLRFEAAILLPGEESESAGICRLALVAAACSAGVLMLLASTLPLSDLSTLGVSGLAGWLVGAISCGLFAAVIATGAAWFNRHRSYAWISWSKVSQASLFVVLAIVLGLVGFHSGLMAAWLGGTATIGLVVLVALARQTNRAQPVSMRRAASAHRRAPLFLLPTAVLETATAVLPVFVISAWFGSDQAGQFSLAWRVLVLPAALIGAAVGQVFYQRFVVALRVGGDVRSMLRRTWLLLAAVGVVPTVLIAATGAEIFQRVFGPEWREAGYMASALAPLVLAIFISSPTSSSFIALGLQRWSLLFGLSMLVYRPAVLLIGVQLNSVLIALLLWSAAEVVHVLTYNAVAWRVILRRSGSREAAVESQNEEAR